jgi:hypothetical protein
MAGRRDAGARPVMSALPSRTMPDGLALLRVLEAAIETLKAENEVLKRRLAVAETRAAQAAITERLDALAAKRRPWRRLAKPAFRIIAAAIATTLIWPGR